MLPPRLSAKVVFRASHPAVPGSNMTAGRTQLFFREPVVLKFLGVSALGEEKRICSLHQKSDHCADEPRIETAKFNPWCSSLFRSRSFEQMRPLSFFEHRNCLKKFSNLINLARAAVPAIVRIFFPNSTCWQSVVKVVLVPNWYSTLFKVDINCTECLCFCGNFSMVSNSLMVITSPIASVGPTGIVMSKY